MLIYALGQAFGPASVLAVARTNLANVIVTHKEENRDTAHTPAILVLCGLSPALVPDHLHS